MAAAFLLARPGCSSELGADSGPLPLSLPGCLLPPAAGAPARPPSSLLLAASRRRWRAPGQGHPGRWPVRWLRSAARGGARSARAGAGAPLGCSPTQARAPATVLKGQLPDCCGAARSWAGVLRAGFRLRGYRALAPVPLRPGLRAPLRAGGRRCRPRRGGCGCRAREAGVAGPGASRRGRRGEAQSGRRRRDAAAARAAARLVFWLAS